MTVPADARCAVHPERDALETCARCGNFMCAVCLSSDAGQLVCTACVQRAAKQGASRRAVGAAGLSGLALVLVVAGLAVRQPVGCFTLPLSALGVGAGAIELAAIRSGAAPEGGLRAARLGVWLGVVALAGAVASVLVMA